MHPGIHSLKAEWFMSKLTSRLPNLGYLGRKVKSSGKTNQSLLIHELNLVHITMPWIKNGSSSHMAVHL